MLEIPESANISNQVARTLIEKKIVNVFPASSKHKFAFYNGNPEEYNKLLTGRKINSTKGHGMFVDVYCDDNTTLTIGEGTNMRYYSPVEQRPEKHQLMIEFDDGSFIAYTVAMYGGIWAYKGVLENPYYQRSINSISPLDEAFDENYFDNIFKNTKADLSMKALLATEQRIPGLGNGVLHDILFNSGLHPRRKKSTVTDFNKGELFHSLKVTLKKMTDMGGRDTEKDLFGQFGGYKTILSKNTLTKPCPNCGNAIVKEAYLGGAVYFCPICQPIK